MNISYLINESRDRARTISAAMLIGAVGAATTLVGVPAQVHADDEWEYEADEGLHEEEWYDPTDWFNDDNRVSYETDWDDYYDDDYNTYDNTYANYDTYGYDYDSYYDGYYDGFNDDKFGADATNASYGDAYYDGYYDGYYDQQSDYNYDPYYYVWVYSNQNRNNESDRQRADDRTRSRGDRAASTGDRDTNRYRAQEYRDLKRVRGTVASTSNTTLQGRPSHEALRIEFKDRDPIYVDFGPKAHNRIDIEKGDTVTVVGDAFRTDANRKAIKAKRVSVNGDRMTLRGDARDRAMARHDRSERDRYDRTRDRRDMARNRDAREPYDRQRDQADSRNAWRPADGARVMRGELSSIRRADIDADEPLIARIRLSDGTTQYVNLGSAVNMSELNLSSGDRISAIGAPRTIDGKEVFVVTALRVNGERISLGS